MKGFYLHVLFHIVLDKGRLCEEEGGGENIKWTLKLGYYCHLV
jgi:hypothetical protein